MVTAGALPGSGEAALPGPDGVVRRFASRDEDARPSYFLPDEVQGDGQPSIAKAYPLEDMFGLHPAMTSLQRAWNDEDVPQCGYCQSGQIMQAASFLSLTPEPSDAGIDAALSGNLCRCGTYVRLRAAVHDAARRLNDS